MNSKKLVLFIVAALAMICFAAYQPKQKNCCINFESMPFTPDTVFKSVHTNITNTCGFSITNENLRMGANNYFNHARVERALQSFGSGHVLNTNNVSFVFTGIGNPHSSISFEYLDMGGTENLSVNGVLYIGELSAAPASAALMNTGVTVAVTATPVATPAKGKKGIVTLTGKIKSFGIGGQEFYLDNVCSNDDTTTTTKNK